MTIFGKSEFREGNNWDVFLNYFFAGLFIFSLIIGIVLNPLIIAYHAKQKKTSTTILFLLVSFIDQFKSLYYPLVLIPKLISSHVNDDHYYITDQNSIPWTAHANRFFLPVCNLEQNLLVVLCVARYASIVHPLSSAKIRNTVFSSVLLLCFGFKVFTCVYSYSKKPFIYIRVTDLVFPSSPSHAKQFSVPLMYVSGSLDCLYLLTGGFFSVLTILHLKRSDSISCESSSKNIRRGIVALIAMNVFNVFVLLSVVGHNIAVTVVDKSGYKIHSTGLDLMHFTNLYGIPLIQSTFNSLSFLVICSAFKVFVRKLVAKRRTGPMPN